MEIASAPTTPESSSSPHLLRRSFTAPIRSTGFSRTTEPPRQTGEQTIETLYTHNAGRIVSFEAYSSAFRRQSSLGYGRLDQQDEPVGTLPWASTTERTIAAGNTSLISKLPIRFLLTAYGLLGPLRIYRAHGSVAFLHSGTTLRPILAKSQCWCVDGESKFVLRIAPSSYYRIELPNSCAEEKDKVEECKKVLAEVLKYEVTPCPFKRGFTVDLPEPPKTPIRIRPWRPKQQTHPVPEQGSAKSQYSHGPERRWSRAAPVEATKAIDHNFISTSELDGAADDSTANSGLSSAESTDHEHDVGGIAGLGLNPETPAELACEEPEALETPTRPKPLRAGRAITAPPHLTLKPVPPSNIAASVPTGTDLRKPSSSLSSSGDSFHSFHSPISPLPPSPPYSDPPSPIPKLDERVSLDVPRVRRHTRDLSDVTATGDSELWDLTRAESAMGDASPSSPIIPKTPPLVSDTASEDHWSEPVTPQPSTELRRREKRLARRSYSPLPSPVNLYSPRNRLSGHHLTTAILQKTCSMLLGPPVQLVALMLNIAAKITSGVRRGASFGYQSGQKIPCSWDFSDAENDSEDTWEEDDYGVALGKVSKPLKAKEPGGSWEID